MLQYLAVLLAMTAYASAQEFERNEYGAEGRPYNNYASGQYRNRDYNRPDARFQGIRNLRTENVNQGDGNYNYFYENDDGTVASQRGYPKTLRSGDGSVAQGNAAEGFYQYYAPDGQLIRVDYTADENGFQPRGDHLPVPPPIPEAIQKSLDLIYANIEKQKQNTYRRPGGEFDYYQRPPGDSNPYRYRPEGGYQAPKPYANRF